MSIDKRTSRLPIVLCAIVCAGAILLPRMASAHGELLIRIASATKRINVATNDLAPLYLERGELYREDQNWAAAEADYAKAAELDPKLVGVDFCHAQMLSDAGRLQESRALFDKYIARYPTDGEAVVGRARVLVKLDQRKEAVADYQRGLELTRDPEPDFFFEQAQNLVALGQGKEALRALDVGIKKLGPVPTLQGFALDLEVERKNYDAALVRLETLMGPAQRKESWLARRGDIFAAAGKPAEARESYVAAQNAVRILPYRIQQGPAMQDLRTRIASGMAALTNAPVTLKTDKKD